MPPTLNRSLTAAVLAAALALASPVAAAETGVRTFTVKYSDLDLSTSGGRTELQRRIARAVKMVCAPVSEKQIKSEAESRACRQATLATADDGLRQAIASAGNSRSIGG